MSDELLDRYIRQQFESQQGPELNVAWRGGEPMLIGLDFFRGCVELAHKYRRPHQTIRCMIHTNGTVLDDEWCVFLQAYDLRLDDRCAGYKAFFTHIDRSMQLMADLLKPGRNAHDFVQILPAEEPRLMAATRR